MQFKGKNKGRQVFTGKLGIHPAKRNGALVKGRVRLIGLIPEGTWPVGYRGFMTAATGRLPGAPLLKMYGEDYLKRWLNDAEGRTVDQVVRFQVQETRRFSVYRQAEHPVVRAIQLATRHTYISHTDVEVQMVLSTSSLSFRVPPPSQVHPYVFKDQRDNQQGKLL